LSDWFFQFVSNLSQLKSHYEELDSLKILPFLDEIDNALVRHVMRKRPQPHALSFGFQYKSSLRTIELGAGVGISKTIHSSNEANLLNDERCSRLVASRLVNPSRAPIRRKDLEDLATAFRDLVGCFGDLEAKVHLIVIKTFNNKALFPDGLKLLHSLPIHKVDIAIAAHAIPRAQMIEPDYDWLRLAQTTECDLTGSLWGSAHPEMFWVQCFPAMQLNHHSNGLRVSFAASPRDLLFRCSNQNYRELFELCNIQIAESREVAPPAPPRKRAKVAQGMGNAYHQRLPAKYVQFFIQIVCYNIILPDLTPRSKILRWTSTIELGAQTMQGSGTLLPRMTS